MIQGVIIQYSVKYVQIYLFNLVGLSKIHLYFTSFMSKLIEYKNVRLDI